MIEAMLAINSPAYQKIYTACGGGQQSPHVVDVRAPASLVPPDTTCRGRRFTLFRGQLDVEGLIVRLDLFAAGRGWNFGATRYQPNPTEISDDGDVVTFESTQSYCGAIGGFVEWTGERWRTFVDAERASRSAGSDAPR